MTPADHAPTEGSRNPLSGQVGYRIAQVDGVPCGGMETINSDLIVAHDPQGVYVLVAARQVLHLSPDEAERIGRVLGWHAERSRQNLAYAAREMAQ